MNAFSITPQQLRRAADIQEQIQDLQSELNSIMSGTVQPAQTSQPAGAPKRQISAAGRARIAAAARARWARERSSKPAKPPKKPTHRLSPAARKRISEIAKARWARAKASGKTKL